MNIHLPSERAHRLLRNALRSYRAYIGGSLPTRNASELVRAEWEANVDALDDLIAQAEGPQDVAVDDGADLA